MMSVGGRAVQFPLSNIVGENSCLDVSVRRRPITARKGKTKEINKDL
ncbi:MAG TPA: hypothetical protein VG098_06445 [Nitrososphaera sp.]|jgi:hypothetical protein|nr:hypothetical protein [Nitrososphaera sp.]